MVIKLKIHLHSIHVIHSPSIHVNLKNAYVTLSTDHYPEVDYNLSFINQKFSRVYGDAAVSGVKFFGMYELITQSNITSSDYKTLLHIFRFDDSKQKENSNPVLLIWK